MRKKRHPDIPFTMVLFLLKYLMHDDDVLLAGVDSYCLLILFFLNLGRQNDFCYL